jgi:hypothetical protein
MTDEFLAKPFRLAELQGVFRTLIEGEPTTTDPGPAAPTYHNAQRAAFD